MPLTTEITEILIDMKTVFLNPLPNCIAVIFGITISAEINSIPTSLIEVTTVIDARTTKA